MIFGLYEDFQKLLQFYDRKLELSGVLAITLILTGFLVAIWVDDGQPKHYVPSQIRTIAIVGAILHMFGIYGYSKKKTSHSPEAEEASCPNCRTTLVVTQAKSWRCPECGINISSPT